MRYLEDFAVGQKFGSATLRVEEERVKRFAAEFDPQPFHLDDAAARATLFGGLAASGWHTAAMTMRLLVESDSSPPAASSARASTNSAGRARCARATSCASKPRCSRCARRNRAPSKAW